MALGICTNICRQVIVLNKIHELENRKQSLHATYFHTGFLLRLFFDPEDGGDMFLQNFR
jgi:hypothetical protein